MFHEKLTRFYFKFIKFQLERGKNATQTIVPVGVTPPPGVRAW